MKTILVPTDFSDNARNALNYAVEIAAKMNSRILLYNFFRVPIYVGDVPIDPVIIEQLEEESYDSLSLLKVEMLERNSKLDIECISASSLNFEVEEICNVAKDNDVDLIVMGTKGASGINKVLMGSNTAHVIENAHCPVMAIPENSSYADFKKILFTTDYNDDDFASIHFIKELANPYDAEIIIVHLADGQASTHHEMYRFDEFKAEITKQLPNDKISFELIEGENFQERMNHFIMDSKTDIIAMSTKKRKLFNRLFDRSLTKEMAYHTHIPLLVFHLH